MSEPRPLHRLFGLSWVDFFEGTSVEVATELDLSLKQQLLDLVLIRKGTGPLPRLPDGFEDLAAHNLVTFKSHQEALDCWSLWELIGHFVNYRKQSSPSMQDLLPLDEFRVLAVCVRWPQNLAGQVELVPLREGVYEARGFGLRIRLIVVHQLPQVEHNAMLHLFSAREDGLRYGQEHFRPHSGETSTLLVDLLRVYDEDPQMSEKLKEYARQSLNRYLASLTPEERLKGLSAEELFKALSPEVREELVRKLGADRPANGTESKE